VTQLFLSLEFAPVELLAKIQLRFKRKECMLQMQVVGVGTKGLEQRRLVFTL